MSGGTDDDDEPFGIMRPYPYIICNAAHPLACLRETGGYCAKCHIPGFHADRKPLPQIAVKDSGDKSE